MAVIIKAMPPLAELQHKFSYDADTGVITWRNPGRGTCPGAVAGTVNAQGYRRVYTSVGTVAAARIAWALGHGQLPPADMEVDHINRVRDDQRLHNLRLVSRGDNSLNRKFSPTSTGVVGVRRLGAGRYRAFLGDAYLGTYPTVEAAASARQAAVDRRA